MMDEKEEACEWIVALKHNLRKAIFEDYRVTVGDTQTVEHYYESLASLDRELCKRMGWEWQVPKESTEVKH
jgi:hypothetical protein